MQVREESQTEESDAYNKPLNLDALQLEMDCRGWSMADLAEASGVSRPTLHQMWKDGGQCSRKTKYKVTRALIANPRAPVEVLAVLGVEP